MATCWTCGSPTAVGRFRCPNCDSLEELRRIRSDLGRLSTGQQVQASAFRDVLNSRMSLLEKEIRSQTSQLQNEMQTQTDELVHGLAALRHSLGTLTSVVRWGLEELTWVSQQQSKTLLDIDLVLRTPSQTEASEKRLIGEELRRRGALGQAEQFLRKAIEIYPLDYRSYISLGYTYLQSERFADARRQFEDSLTHAPEAAPPRLVPQRSGRGSAIGERNQLLTRLHDAALWHLSELRSDRLLHQFSGIRDWRSYSLRLIGRTWLCEGDLSRAVDALETAVMLSPGYAAAGYDLASYLSQAGQRHRVRPFLEQAVAADPEHWATVRLDPNLLWTRDEMDEWMQRFLSAFVAEASEEIAYARTRLEFAVADNELARENIYYYMADQHIKIADQLRASGDLSDLRKIPFYIEEAITRVLRARKAANELRELRARYQARLAQPVQPGDLR